MSDNRPFARSAAGAAFDSARTERIRAAVERIQRDRRFVHSQALCRFLRYTVEETLQGRGDSLKESVLGIEVFERPSFDPRIDPIVRVQAAKLRTRLQQYYEAEGAAEDIVIDYPKGSYTPVFRDASAAAAQPDRPGVVLLPPSRRLRHLRLAAAAVAAAGVAVAAFVLLRHDDRRPHAVELERLTSDTGVAIFPAVSRDGRLAVYSSDRAGNDDVDLWLKPLPGGSPVRLTTAPGADITPDFSPDGRQVVFRSNRERAGLYLVTVIGSAETRLTDTGWRPRFSPDGKWIVYQGPGNRPGGELWLVPATGGQPRLLPVRNNVQLGGGPTWTPDGEYVLFSGADESQRTDWWVVSRQGGDAVRSGLARQLEAQGLGDLSFESLPGEWIGEEMLFAMVRGSTSNLWRVPFSSRTWTVSGPVRQLTFGSAMELSPRASATGRVVFSSDVLLTHLWSIRPGSHEQRPLTSDSSLRPGHFRLPTRFSAAGRLLAFASARSGNSDIWIRDRSSGAETAVAGAPEPEEHPLFSPDGTTIAYVARYGSRHALKLVDVAGRVSRELCGNCGEPFAWLPDGRRVLYGLAQRRGSGLAAIDIETGARRPWIVRDDLSVTHATVSPDSRWIMFVAVHLGSGDTLWQVAPLENGVPAPQSRWTHVAGVEPEGPVVFSFAGDRVFYLASADGYRCLWAHRFQPASGRLGPAEPVHHFHNNRLRPWNAWLWLSGEEFIVALTESTSNLWSFRVTP